MQEAGFILNRIYFNYGTSTKGTTLTGGGPLHRRNQIFNLKLVGAMARHQITIAFAHLKSDHSIRRLSCTSVSQTLFPAPKKTSPLRTVITPGKTTVGGQSHKIDDSGWFSHQRRLSLMQARGAGSV